jgi:hypothetical protein
MPIQATRYALLASRVFAYPRFHFCIMNSINVLYTATKFWSLLLPPTFSILIRKCDAADELSIRKIRCQFNVKMIIVTRFTFYDFLVIHRDSQGSYPRVQGKSTAFNSFYLQVSKRSSEEDSRATYRSVVECIKRSLSHESTNVTTNSVEPEPEGSSPHSQQPANGPCPEPGESTPPPPPTTVPKISIFWCLDRFAKGSVLVRGSSVIFLKNQWFYVGGC